MRNQKPSFLVANPDINRPLLADLNFAVGSGQFHFQVAVDDRRIFVNFDNRRFGFPLFDL
jgi:hypothetical protein